MTFVLDSSSLIYLGKLKVIEKLDKIEGEKYLPRAVFNEVVLKGYERGEPEAKYIEDLIEKKKLIIKNPSHRLNILSLSEADVDVISLAKEINAIPIIDDEEACKVAEFYELDYHGSIYLLISLLNKKLISKKTILNYIDKMIELGFYISTETYKEILKKIK